jgi:hypothetical protein
MNNRQPLLLLPLCLLVAALAACGGNQAAPSAAPAPAPAPTPAPAPAPAPAPTLTTITGSVSESEPTTSVALGGATISSGSYSATADGAGNFALPDLPAGTYTLRASKSGYDDATQTITVPGDTSVVRFKLDPAYEPISVERSEIVSQDDPECPGSHGNYTCFRYIFPSHHERGVTANLYWSSSDAKLELALLCNDYTWARTEGETPRLITRNSEEVFTFQILENARKGQMCEVRVLHISGDPQRFTLTVTHPN